MGDTQDSGLPLPDRWLNDEVINCYLRLIQERSGNRCWCPGSFFWLKLEKEGHAGVQRWARRAKVDVSSLQAILLAIHREGTHWGLGVLDLQGRALRYFDSLGIAPPLSLAARLNEYLEGEIHAWRWGFDFSPLPMLHDKEAPRQQMAPIVVSSFVSTPSVSWRKPQCALTRVPR